MLKYQEILALATKDLPSGIDYSKYVPNTSKSNLYSKSDLDAFRFICVNVARNLLVRG